MINTITAQTSFGSLKIKTRGMADDQLHALGSIPPINFNLVTGREAHVVLKKNDSDSFKAIASESKGKTSLLQRLKALFAPTGVAVYSNPYAAVYHAINKLDKKLARKKAQ